eukprot:Phypoly_transcript_04449.p1 GENE.Phypoly_transcript_04449~~Phypoly_transcript_04449.p1  ORF type:complete len:609 (+),score=93.89 Phypoly_transcript_04449:107-1933(+)
MSLSRKNSTDEIREHKNPLFMRTSSTTNAKQWNKISDMFSAEEMATLMQNLQAKSGDASPMARSRSSTSSPANQAPPSPTAASTPKHINALSRLSMKMRNRKSVEIEPGFLRTASAPQQTPVSDSLQRRNSMEISREPSFRYRAGSDAPLPTFNTNGDEKEDRAIITSSASFSVPHSHVSLYCSSDSLYPPAVDPDEAFCSTIVYADDKRKIVESATVDQLIYLLAGNNAPDKDFISQFLRTHHRFVDSKEFLQKLINRYNLPAAQNISEEEYIKKKKIVQVRIINVIKKWIELQITEFQRNEKLQLMLLGFVATLFKTGGTEAIWASNLKIAVVQSEDEQEKSTITTEEDKPPPKSIVPKNNMPKFMQFLEVSPVELARQLTLMDSCALCKIQFDEYDHKNWCGSKKTTLAPNLLEVIERFNKTSFWIASEILRQPEQRLRVKVLSKAIKLMKHLLDMGNMQGMMAVYSAVNTTPVQRLQEMWKALPGKYHVILKTVGELMNSSGNYKNYREHVRSAVRPFIPFQLIYLTDLTFLEEAPDILTNGHVNFHKMALIGTLVNEIHQFQIIKALLYCPFILFFPPFFYLSFTFLLLFFYFSFILFFIQET